MKPVVDRIEQQSISSARVVRLDIFSEVGMQAARQYGVRAVPTLIVFDACGNTPSYNVGFLNPEHILAQIDTARSCIP